MDKCSASPCRTAEAKQAHTGRLDQLEGNKNDFFLACYQTHDGAWVLVSKGWQRQFYQETESGSWGDLTANLKRTSQLLRRAEHLRRKHGDKEMIANTELTARRREEKQNNNRSVKNAVRYFQNAVGVCRNHRQV